VELYTGCPNYIMGRIGQAVFRPPRARSLVVLRSIPGTLGQQKFVPNRLLRGLLPEGLVQVSVVAHAHFRADSVESRGSLADTPYCRVVRNTLFVAYQDKHTASSGQCSYRTRDLTRCAGTQQV